MDNEHESGQPATRTLGEPIVITDGVKKWFGDFQALKGVTATVHEREVVVIIGPSGSGKSTYIRCINRLEAHQEGTIIVDGTELTNDIKNIEKIRSEVGMVFQQFNLFPHLTVMDNITLAPQWVRKEPKAEAENTAMELLERVGIPEQADKFPGQLSGGQQQRVAIARSLADEAADHVVRRADIRPRSGDDQRGSRRDEGTGTGRHDDDGRHPRDGLRS